MNEHEANLSFEIKTHHDYYKNLLLPQYSDFMTKENIISSRHAIICCILAYHLREWIWKCDSEMVKSFVIKKCIVHEEDKGNDKYVECKYNEYVNEQCAYFRSIRLICNGSKHFVLGKFDNKSQTYLRKGGLSSGLDGMAFRTHDLIFELDDGSYLLAKRIISSSVEFWGAFLKELYEGTK